MPIVRVVVRLVVFLIGVLQANLEAAPVPFQPYGQISSIEVILQLAVLNDSPWAEGLENIQGLELSSTNEVVLSAFEELINQYIDDELTLALLIPLYWFKSEKTGHTLHRQFFLNTLSNESDLFLRLANVDMLLQWHELSQAESESQDYGLSSQDIRLKYAQLQSSFDQPEQNYLTQIWAKALLYFYMPGGGLKVVDVWLQSLASIDKPEVIVVYRKLLHDLAGQPFPPSNPSCWPLTCANAMTTDEMARRAQRADKFFSNDGFSQAWQYLKAGVHCLYNAQSNPANAMTTDEMADAGHNEPINFSATTGSVRHGNTLRLECIAYTMPNPTP